MSTTSLTNDSESIGASMISPIVLDMSMSLIDSETRNSVRNITQSRNAALNNYRILVDIVNIVLKVDDINETIVKT
jgi:hypothetical protein